MIITIANFRNMVKDSSSSLHSSYVQKLKDFPDNWYIPGIPTSGCQSGQPNAQSGCSKIIFPICLIATCAWTTAIYLFLLKCIRNHLKLFLNILIITVINDKILVKALFWY